MTLDALLDIDEKDVNAEMFRRGDFDFITVRDGGDAYVNEKGELRYKHLKQEAALRSLTDQSSNEIVYGGAAGGAKTWTGCAWVLFSAYLYPETKWFIGRDELNKIESTTLLTFHRVAKTYGFIRGVDYQYLQKGHCIKFANGSQIDLLQLKYMPKKDPLFERFGSLEYTGGWMEEGGECHFGAFDTLKSRVGRMNNDRHRLARKLFVTCNPKKNWLYREFFKPAEKGMLLDYQVFIQSLVSDNPFIESGYVEGLLSIKDVARKERLLKGNWDYDDDPAAIMPYININDLFTNQHVLRTGIRYITVDVARQGKDATKIYVWDGFVCFERHTLTKAGTDVVEQKIKDLANKYNVPMSRVVVDADGIGGGVVDHLKCQEFLNQSTPFEKENYANKRAQMYFALALLVNAGGMYLEGCEPELKEQISLELSVIKKKNLDGDGKDDIIDRKSIIELIGSSPDNATCLMLRMFFTYFKPIKKPKYSLV
ncbi:phage terminase large subunit [Pedobacter sp. SYP-B3415]|uniref:phage terminase large subunit n=1 Tax=Pedobacter sp. SYP-B3415 TaxID=2496641 RepID=UPI00101D8E0E|nr:phage terminase large subunit [Pedobacter sp. SYP-B3415]